MNKPLAGLCLLNTRPLHQGKVLTNAINKAGGKTISCPALAIKATPATWLNQLTALSHIDYVLFTSANAVTYFFAHYRKRWPTTLPVIAIGPGTKAALQQRQIYVDFMPINADSEHVLALGLMQDIKGKTVLLCKGKSGRTLIAETLLQRGAQVVITEVYERILPVLDQHFLDSIWQEQAVNIILFTSQQAMHNIFKLFGEKAYHWLRHCPCVVFSERLAKAARQMGIKTIIISRPEQLMATLQQFKQGLFHGYEQ